MLPAEAGARSCGHGAVGYEALVTLPEEAGAEATSRELIAEIIEQEIEVLRRLRPTLKSRIDRASTLLVAHLASPRARRIRVRSGAGGDPTFLVSSSSQGGVVYS